MPGAIGEWEQFGFADRLNQLFETVRAPDTDRAYTGKEVAAAVGVSASHLSELRRGIKTNPSMRVVHALSAFFGVRPGYLCGDRGVVAEVEAELHAREALDDLGVRDLVARVADIDPRHRATLLRLLNDRYGDRPG